MKKQSKIRSLSTEDQNRIRQLCDGNPYDAVVELVAKPREQGGLDFKTNRSALSRFCSEHGTLAVSSQLADQFLDLIEKQPFDLDDLIPPMAHLVGQSAFLLLAQHRPFEEYRRPLDAFMRLERLSREREKLQDEREQNRRAHAQIMRDLSLLPQDPAPNATQPSASSPAPACAKSVRPPQSRQTAATPKPSAPSTPPVPPVTLDYTLPSFKNASGKSQSQSKSGNPASLQSLHLPKTNGLFSDFSLENARNLTNLTKSHITTAPSQKLPVP